MEVPPPESVLRAASPADLFGPDCLTDRRALRRSYAGLIRVYTPEAAPEVFAHIRALFEAAQISEASDSAADEAPSELAAPADPPNAEASANWLEANLVELEELMDQGRWAAASKQLDATAPELGRRQPLVWVRIAYIVARVRSTDESAATLRSRRGVLDSLGDRVDPELLHRLELMFTGILAMQDALRDPTADSQLVLTLAQTWFADPDTSAKRWLEYKQAHPDSCRHAVDYLRLHHPMVMRVYRRVAARITGRVPTHRKQLQGERVRSRSLRVPRGLRWSIHPELLADDLSLSVVPVVVVVVWIIQGWFAFGTWTMVAIASLVYVTLRRGWRGTLARLITPKDDRRWATETRPRVVAWLRKTTAWPFELAALLHPKDTPSITRLVWASWPDDHNVAWRETDHLLQLEREESLVLDCLTQDHVERVRVEFEAARPVEQEDAAEP